MSAVTFPRISFEPPLPFTGKQLTGFVIEASRHELRVRSLADSGHATTDQLTILDSDGRDHKLRVHSISARSQNEFSALLVDDSENLRVIDDLLGGMRKNQHINICQHQDIEASDRFTGFSHLHFLPSALPDMSWEDVDTSSTFLNRRFSLPILITGMTGGVDKGADINRRLALTAAKFNIPMGIGSQRLALENPSYSHIFSVKQHAPGLFLIANVGFAQLNLGYDVSTCQRAVDMIEADALAIHINALQEVVQVEGDRDFRGLLQKISTIAKRLSVPVVIKEVGNGIDPLTAKRLHEAGVSAVDVGGRGGTSWGYIEGLRSHSPTVRHVAETFRDWGIPTAHALAAVKNTLGPSMDLIATGGIRDGLTIAKAVSLGAAMAGVGLPLLRAALVGDDEPAQVLESYAQELKVAMICTDSRVLNDLKGKLVQGLPFADAVTERLEHASRPLKENP